MKQYFCAGTYTEPILFGTGEVFQGKGKGVYLCAFDGREISILSVLPLRNPSFLCLHEERRKIYAVNELKEYLGGFGGGVSEISYGAAGEMSLRSTFGTGGTDPCHVETSPGRDLLAVSNFASGSLTVFPLDGEGSILPGRSLFEHEGSSVHPVRQRGPHAHSAVFAGGSLFVPDLGLDRLMAYSVREGRVRPDPLQTVALPPGSGPRFGEFAPNGRDFYLINEIASSVTRFVWDGGVLSARETAGTLPADYDGGNICSDLHVTPDGKFLYASNRGHDSIAAFAIAPDGSLRFIERQPCRGRTPRNFAIDPTGSHLLVGNQSSDTIVAFSIGGDGRLSFLSETAFPTPVCIRFFRGGFEGLPA